MKKLIISFLFLMVSLPLFAQENGALSFFSGEVKVKENGRDWQPARLNMEIKTGDEIKTGADSKAEIKIGNDLIKIDGNTHFVVAELAKKSLFEVALGKAWFRVKKIRGNTIEVKTPTAVVGVRGTIFSIEVRDGITLLDVLKGMVEALIKEKSFIVRGGEGLRTDPAGPVRRKLTPDEKKVFRKKVASLTPEGQRSNLQSEIRSVR
ncbi:FecR family protein, partial [bacterium]|nr:FecR family protein [bacterium]